jgi:predicted RNA-binding Zn ribbon-like protein
MRSPPASPASESPAPEPPHGARGPDFLFVANERCLDFVNTEMAAHGLPVDLLAGFDDLVAWLERADVLDPAAAGTAVSRWGSAGPEAAAGALAFSDAVRLRTALRAMAGQLAAGAPVEEDVLAAVNSALAARPAITEVARAGAGYVTRVRALGASPTQLVVPVAESAAALLEHGRAGRVRRCGGPGCVLYFYDTTKNGSRRWCSMDGCGGRQKAAAYYRRTRARSG